MRARINHGKRGVKIDTLLKRYEMQYPHEYYDYIIKSYEYGHKDQVIELFNLMKGEQQKSFLRNCECQILVWFIIHNL